MLVWRSYNSATMLPILLAQPESNASPPKTNVNCLNAFNTQLDLDLYEDVGNAEQFQDDQHNRDDSNHFNDAHARQLSIAAQ